MGTCFPRYEGQNEIAKTPILSFPAKDSELIWGPRKKSSGVFCELESCANL